MMRSFTLLFVLMFAGGPVAAAACANDCAPPEAAQANSGCHEHPAQERGRTRVVALHICDDATSTAPGILDSPAYKRAVQAPVAVVATAVALMVTPADGTHHSAWDTPPLAAPLLQRIVVLRI